jgi:poly(A) polymerase
MRPSIANNSLIKGPQPNTQPCRIIRSPDHKLTKDMMNSQALEVVEKLTSEGFQAFIVGGSIRDLLLNRVPKDFDVATNANPIQIKSLFDRARIIGRRFQIVHVKLNKQIIEVTTFRSNNKDLFNEQRIRTKNGMLTRDNVFGSLTDDSIRRDLSVNAFYYDPHDNTITDFTNGFSDIREGIIRIIGDPATRYREDPLRLLRVVRFAAKLNFLIDSGTRAPIKQHGKDLKQISAPRLFDESLKLFMSGHGLKTFELLNEFDLLRHIFPRLSDNIDSNDLHLKIIQKALTNTDYRVENKQRVTPAFIFAAFLWPEVQSNAKLLHSQGKSVRQALEDAAEHAIACQIRITAIPKRFTLSMRQIWSLQISLEKNIGARAHRLIHNPRFRAAYDFVLLREQAGENLNGLGDWWTKYQTSDEKIQRKMISTRKQQHRRKR